MQFFLNTTVNLRLEIQPALKLSSVSRTLGAIYSNPFSELGMSDEPV